MITDADVRRLQPTNADVAAAMREWRRARGALRGQFPGQDPGDYAVRGFSGTLGQVMGAGYYNVSPFAGATVDHDAEVNGHTVDFKTGARFLEDKPDVDRLALVRADLKEAQRPEVYVFLEVGAGQRVWLYGWLSAARYHGAAALVKRGGGRVARYRDAYALPLREVNPAWGFPA